MVVSEFIEWLKCQDQGAIVRCIRHDPDGGLYMQGGSCDLVEFDDGKSSYTDLRNNMFVGPESQHYGKRYITIGEYDK